MTYADHDQSPTFSAGEIDRAFSDRNYRLQAVRADAHAMRDHHNREYFAAADRGDAARASYHYLERASWANCARNWDQRFREGWGS